MDGLEPDADDYIEECDAANDETFGEENEDWDWEAAAEDESGDVNQNNGHSSILQSSNLNRSNFPTGPDVSSIRRLSELEASFSSISVQERESVDRTIPDDDDPAIMSYSSNRFNSSSLLGNSVWAPPDASLFGATASTGLITSSSKSPVPPPPPSDPWTSPLLPSDSSSIRRLSDVEASLTRKQPVMTLEELEASLLSESNRDSLLTSSQGASSWSHSSPLHTSSMSVMNQGMIMNDSERRSSSSWNSSGNRPPAAKTLEEIEAEMLSSPAPIPSIVPNVKTLEEIERELLASSQPAPSAPSLPSQPTAPTSTPRKGMKKKPASPLPSPPTPPPPSFAAVVNPKVAKPPPPPAPSGLPVNQSPASSARQPTPGMIMNPAAFPPLSARPSLASSVVPPMIPLTARPGGLPVSIPGQMIVPRPLIMHPHLMPMNIQQRFLVLQQASYRPPHLQQRHPGPGMFVDPRMQVRPMFAMRPQFPQMDGRRFDRPRFQGNYQTGQRQYHHQQREEQESRNSDEYSGLMSPREKEWLIKVQKLQLEGSITDPYVEDYYAMCFNSKKLQETRAKDKKNAPTLVVVDRSKRKGNEETEDNNNKPNSFVPKQFQGSLGKLQVSNIKCPRKLLDVKRLNESNEAPEDTPLARKELTKLRKLLLEIERLYTVLLNIDYEDKKIAGLPEAAREPSLQQRKELCLQLFQGITQEDGKGVRVNMDIANIRKGCHLIFRSLEFLKDKRHKSVIVSDLKHNEELKKLISKHSADQAVYGFDFEAVLKEAENSLKWWYFQILLLKHN